MEPISPPAKRPLEVLEFYYPDARATAPSAFVANGITVDRKVGDTLDFNHETRTVTVHTSTGRTIVVPPNWLWYEHYVVMVEDKPLTKPPTP